MATSASVAVDKFQFMVIPPECYQEVLDLHQQHFLRDEPLFRSINVPASGRCNDLDEFCLNNLRQGYSIMAVKPESGQIAGIVISSSLKKEDATEEKEEEELKSYKDEAFVKVIKIGFDLVAPVDVFQLFKVDKILYLQTFFVVPKFRNCGLGKELLRKVIEQARVRGYKLLKADSSGLHSQRVFKSVGFKVYNEIMYKNYMIHGEVVFPDTGGNPSLQLVLLDLH